jgi:hypothetical protein
VEHVLVRRGTKLYWYTSQRVGRKVLRFYGGSGEAALEAARIKQECRRLLQAARQAAIQAEQRYLEATAPLVELTRVLELVTKATLTRAGYHQHSRGPWRKKRGHTDKGERIPG